MPEYIFHAVNDRLKHVAIDPGSIYIVRIEGTPFSSNIAGPFFNKGSNVITQQHGLGVFYIHRSGATPTSVNFQLVTESRRHRAVSGYAPIILFGIGTAVSSAAASVPTNPNPFPFEYFFFNVDIQGGNATTIYEIQLRVA